MEREPDNPEIKRAWEKSKEYSRNVINNLEPGIHINDSQPRCGKTYSLADVISEIKNRRLAFFTANHDHLKDFKEDLEKFGIHEGEYIHGKGFRRSCLRYPPENKKREEWTDDEKLVHKIYNGFGVKSSRFLCRNCNHEEECEYYEYTHNAKNYRITLQPLEFLYTNYNNDKGIFVVDETVNKKESLYWDFNLDKLEQFIFDIKDITNKYYALEEHIDALKNFHKTVLQQNSLIFTESPDTVFNHDRVFKGREGFLQNGSYITHPGKINLFDSDAYGDLFNILNKEKLEGIIKYTDKQIRNAIKEGNSVTIDRLIENYIPLWHCLQIFEVLVCKARKKVYFLVSEKLEKKPFKNLHSPKKFKTGGNYEYGFTAEYYPYIRNIKTNKCVTSRMGKCYESTEKPLTERSDAWFTLGRPYLFQVFNEAEERSVLLLDATYNNMIFKKLHDDWRSSRRIKKGIIEGQYHPTIHGEVDRIKRPHITNKNSILYVVDSDKNSYYPKSNLIKKEKDGNTSATNTLRKVVASIITIIEENPDKEVASCSHRKIEQALRYIPLKERIHYYNQRGKNISAKILACIGTPYIKPIDLLYDYILMLNEFPKSTEVIRTSRFEGYKDEELNAFFEARVIDELYQALHRNAPLVWNRVNYLFGRLPDKIKEELNVKHIKLEDICNWYTYNTMVKIDKNDGMRYKICRDIHQWKIFNKEYRPKDFLSELEKKGLINIEVRGTKKNPKEIACFTTEGLDLYRKYRKAYGGFSLRLGDN